MQIAWMLDNVQEAVVWMEGKGQIIWCNVAFAELIDASREQVLGCSLVSVLPLANPEEAISSALPTRHCSCYQNRQPFSETSSTPWSGCRCQDKAPTQRHPVADVLQTRTAGERLFTIQRGVGLPYRPLWLSMVWQWIELPTGEEGSVLRFRSASPRSHWEELDLKAYTPVESKPGSALEKAPSSLSERALQLLQLVHHDPLTGLLNRFGLFARLTQLLRVQQQSEPLSFQLLCFDLDRFKRINDGLGYSVGDRLLIDIVQRIVAQLDPTMTLARLDGDEFAIILESGADHDPGGQVHALAQQLQTLFQTPFLIDQQPLFITASLGSVIETSRYTRAEELMRDADTAMYRAKAIGAGLHQVFEPVMHRQVYERLQLETDIHYAIASHELVVHYQPIVALKSCKVKSFEALLRWQHPHRGLIGPDIFIPIAEENGQIVPLGMQVLRQACEQLQAWKRQFSQALPISIGVNLSAKQMSHPGLVGQIEYILNDVGLAPQSLCLEITESTVMENVESGIKVLHELKALGIQLALDDFGTGHSSLGYLHRFPIDTIKLDRSFVQNIDTDAEKIEITRMLVTLAWNIGLEVIAEGIEKPTQLAQLRALQCEQGQGYHFARPLSAADAQDFLQGNP
ncbi:MAG: bifunctional diguanylate cyclase/phosphodiesterase [Elainellaceae cyanobacterium]